MRIPILLSRHSSELKKLEIDTYLRIVYIQYVDDEVETRKYNHAQFKDCTLVFTIETSNKYANIKKK